MSAERYASLADLQEMLTERVSASASLERLLGSASTAVEEHCGRVFTRDSAASERLYSPTLADQAPVDDIADAAGVTVSTGSGPSWTVLDAADWWLGPQNATGRGRAYEMVYSQGRFTAGTRPTLKVSAVWGWPSVPGPVTEAVLLFAARLYSRRSSPSGVAGFSDFGVVRVTATDADVRALLAPYVKEGFG